MSKVVWIGRPGFESYHGAAGGEDELVLHEGMEVEVSADQAAYLEETFAGLGLFKLEKAPTKAKTPPKSE